MFVATYIPLETNMNGPTDPVKGNNTLKKAVLYILWAALFIIPTLLTKIATSQYINGVVILGIQFLIVAFTWKQTILGARLIALRFPVVLTILVITLAVGFPDTRNQIYLVSVLLVFSLIGQYQTQGVGNIFAPIINIKVLIIFGIALYFSLFYLFFSETQLTDDYFSTGLLPLYRSMRHFNFELAFGVPLSAFLLFRYPTNFVRQFFFAFCIGMFFYYSLASGGRGQALAMLITGTLVISKLGIDITSREIKVFIAALAIGGGLVFLTGQADYLLQNSVQKTVNIENYHAMSSGRWAIWYNVLTYFNQQDWQVLLVGNSAESHDYFYAMKYYSLSQPHNSLVQVVLEYGYLGLLFFCYLSILLIRNSIRNIWQLKTLNYVTLASATMLGIWVFSLTDGLFYHGLPLTMVIVLVSVIVNHNLPPNRFENGR